MTAMLSPVPPERSSSRAVRSLDAAGDAVALQCGSFGSGYPSVPEDPYSPARLLRYVLHYRWFLGGTVVLALIAGILFTLIQTPRYAATATLEILVPSARVFEDLEIVPQGTDLRAFATAREKLESRSIAGRVVEALELDANPEFPASGMPIWPAVLKYARESEYLAGIAGLLAGDGSGDRSVAEPKGRAIRQVRENLVVEPLGNTSLLAITYRDDDPVIAAAVANEVTRAFIEQRLDQDGQTSELASRFIEKQVLEAKDRLQASEEALVDYAKSAGLTMDDTNGSLILTSIRDINSALSSSVRERLDHQRSVRQIEEGQGASLPQVLESAGIARIRERLAELQAEYRLQLATFKPDYPPMRQLSAQIGEMRRQEQSAIGVVTSSIALELEDAIAKEADLRAKLDELEAAQSDFQDRNIRYTILKREVDSNRSQYDSLIAKLNEVGVGSQLREEGARIVDEAVPPRDPYAPRLPVNVALSLVLFMGAAAGTIYVRELLDDTFTGPSEIEAELKLPVLGILPGIAGGRVEEACLDMRSGLSEAYRSLRTALRFTGGQGAPKTLLVTSAGPEEGKSTTSLKLAQDFAILGAKVLLVDADLRKPTLHRMFQTGNFVGLGDLLADPAMPDPSRRVIRDTPYANLKLLTSGTLPANPADVLSSPRMAQLLGIFCERFDMIIIDAPPVAGLSDAPILARLAEGTLLVVSARQVSRKSAVAALRRLHAAGARLLGVTLTKFTVARFDDGYAYAEPGRECDAEILDWVGDEVWSRREEDEPGTYPLADRMAGGGRPALSAGWPGVS